jgi:proteasome lid subunit RPN8/RPN11
MPRKLLAEMIAHAQEEAPAEACGILAGENGRVLELFRVRNVDRSPVSYRMDREEQYRVLKDIEQRGWELVGIYHSHPASPATPSETDERQAGYPEASYVLISVADADAPQVRAFRIGEQGFAEEEIAVT